MKNLTLISMAVVSLRLSAQAPASVNYQAAARNSNGQVIANQVIGLQISILDGGTSGTEMYRERHFVSTNNLGLFTIQIGSGTVQSGNMSTINWSQNSKFLKVEMDPTGGSNFITMSNAQIVSVPYALYANTAGSLNAGSKITPAQISSAGASVNEVLQWNGTSWVPGTIITKQNTNSTLTGDGTVSDPLGLAKQNAKPGDVLKWNGNSWVPSAEDQVISRNGDTIFLSSGGFVVLPDLSQKYWGTAGNTGSSPDFLGTLDSRKLTMGTKGNGHMVLDTQGRLGLNTTAPSEILDVAGKTKTEQIQITQGAAAGNFLSSDANGNGTWSAVTGRLVGVYNASGFGNNTLTSTLAFIGATQSITLKAGQKVLMIVNKSLGSTASGGASNLAIYPGYQLSGGSVLGMGGAILGLQCAQNTRQLYGIQWCFNNLAAGTYTFGLAASCGSGAANWNSNDYGYITLLVFE